MLHSCNYVHCFIAEVCNFLYTPAIMCMFYCRGVEFLPYDTNNVCVIFVSNIISYKIAESVNTGKQINNKHVQQIAFLTLNRFYLRKHCPHVCAVMFIGVLVLVLNNDTGSLL